MPLLLTRFSCLKSILGHKAWQDSNLVHFEYRVQFYHRTTLILRFRNLASSLETPYNNIPQKYLLLLITLVKLILLNIKVYFVNIFT